MAKASSSISALILAGGRGSRMGGVDKGLQLFRGRPLVAHALERLHTQQGVQFEEIFINANRSAAEYAVFGHPVLSDAAPEEFAGPLAGFLAGLQACHSDYLLTVPCDCPLFPLDLAQRLMLGLQAEQAEIAMAFAPENIAIGAISVRAQPVFCLINTRLKASLESFLQSGGRKIDHWTAQERTVSVSFDLPHDDPQGFANINTLEELLKLENQ